RVFRPDVYRSALSATNDPLPTASSKVEGSVSEALQASTQDGTILLENNTFFDGQSFDPDMLETYIAAQK
ncbi:MAG: nitrate transporter, partial [Pseudomonadota bacterium]